EANNRLANALASMTEFFFRCRRVRFHEANNRVWKATQLSATSKPLTSAEWKALSIRTARQPGIRPGNDEGADSVPILDHGPALENIAPPWRKDPPLIAGVGA